MLKLTLFNANLPGKRLALEVSSTVWSDVLPEISSALNAINVDSKLLETTNAFFADNNSKIVSETMLPNVDTEIKIVLVPRKDIDSGLGYNEMRAEAKRRGINLGSNPKKEELEAALYGQDTSAPVAETSNNQGTMRMSIQDCTNAIRTACLSIDRLVADNKSINDAALIAEENSKMMEKIAVLQSVPA